MVIPLRLKALAASGILAGGLGAAALSGAFAAPASSISAAVEAAPAATATATATTTASTKPSGRVGRFERGVGMLGPVAGFLGISTTDLQAALQNGQTLAQIAQAHGKSANDLKTFLTTQLKTRLDKAVAAKQITSQQETDILNKASSNFDKMINSNFQHVPGNGPGPRGGGWIRGKYLSTVAQTLGMKPADVQTELKGGKTLAQIAQEHGKTANDLETAILNSLKPRLDKLMNTNFQQLQQQRAASRQNHRTQRNQATPSPTA